MSVKGSQIISAAKTIQSIGNRRGSAPADVALGSRCEGVDKNHISLIRVKTADGAPIFGIDSPVGIHVDEIDTKLFDKNADYDVSIEGKSYVLFKSENSEIRVRTATTETRELRLPEMKLNPFEIDHKALKDVCTKAKKLKQDKGLQRITIRAENGEITASAVGAVGTVKNVIGRCGSSDDLRVLLDPEIIGRIMSSIPAKAKVGIGLDTDYPVQFDWQVDNLVFESLVAPVIDCGERA